jgi:HPt (histidine-containing phosphotransfer) domain-containing protein
LAALTAGEDGAEMGLAMLFHRLAGSGGAYGFPQVSVTARELERLIRSEPHWTPARLAEVHAGIQEIADAFGNGGAE